MSKPAVQTMPAANLVPGDVVVDYDRFERTVVHPAHDVRNGVRYLVATMNTGSLWAYAEGVTVQARPGDDRPYQVECIDCRLSTTVADRPTAAELIADHADQGHTAMFEPTLPQTWGTAS